ncbi:hypothetical protein TSMEX_001598 [Taenia solium]|eukprot:TsM_000915900 transcript=TsM_000915900 gene=TsM_000915900
MREMNKSSITLLSPMQSALHPDNASTDGQASIVGIDEMTVKCCPAYPKIRPDATFDSPIFHPNIGPSAPVEDTWSKKNGW